MSINDYKLALENDLKRFKEHEALALELEPIIHSFKNRTLNKRLATAIENKTGLIVHWQARVNYSGGKEYEMSVWGNNGTYDIKYDNKLSFYYFETIDKLQEDIDRYIEARNSVMHGVNEQKRYELANIESIELNVNQLKADLNRLNNQLSDKSRDFGKISYKLKDYIKSQLDI